LIRAFKGLTSRGVLRLGGNISEFVWWKPAPNPPEPEHPQTRVIEGEPKAQYYAVTPEAVRNLAGFLKATGWTCLYGIGMGTNTPERAAEEAEFLARTLGASLQYYQLAMRWIFSRATCAIQKHGPKEVPGGVAHACSCSDCPRAGGEVRDAGCRRVCWMVDGDRPALSASETRASRESTRSCC
jgi:hypothetical protein